MSIGEKIKKLRKENKLTLEELASKVNTTAQTIFKYENNIITNIPSDKIEKLAVIFHTTPAYLMGWEKKQEKKQESIKITHVPLYSCICCGNGFFVDDNVIETITLPEDFLPRKSTYLKGGMIFG